MKTPEQQYLKLLQLILDTGEHRADRTGTGTRAIFSHQLKFDVVENFPLLTTKRVGMKAIWSELLWFLEGSGDERRLSEILHGSRAAEKETIWTPNAKGTTGTKYKPKYPGDLGRVYGVPWRSWTNNVIIQSNDDIVEHDNGVITQYGATVQTTKIDQIADVINKLKNNPTDRRIIVTAWNPGELDQMALPPCHMFMQFYLSNDKRLHCQMYQRSVDTFLGLPFNMASYAALMYIIANEVGATPGVLTMCLGDTHIYMDHMDQVKELLSRTPKQSPTFKVTHKPFNELTMNDYLLLDYNPDAAIKGKIST